MTPIEIMVPGFKIRPATRKDLPALLEVYRACEDFLALGPEPHASEKMVLKDLENSANEGGHFCGIYLEQQGTSIGRMVGVIDWIDSGYCGQPSWAYLSLLMIAAPYRSLGAGSRIMVCLEKALQSQGITDHFLHVQVNNPGGQRFWQRCGYQVIDGPVPNPDGTVVFHLHKSLSSL